MDQKNESEWTASSENAPKEAAVSEYEALVQNSKKLKKRIQKIALIGLIALLLLIGILALVNHFLNQKDDAGFGNYYFYPPYEGDIMQNQTYLQMNREFCYCADPTGMGVTYPLNEEELTKLDPSVGFVCDYLRLVIAGDSVAYNALFTQEYLAENGSKDAFNPQMLHNITIYLYQELDNGDGSKTVTYKLDYMIYRNDGSFRRDIGSDSIRSQYLVLHCEKDGSIAIKDLVSFRVDSYIDPKDR